MSTIVLQPSEKEKEKMLMFVKYDNLRQHTQSWIIEIDCTLVHVAPVLAASRVCGPVHD